MTGARYLGQYKHPASSIEHTKIQVGKYTKKIAECKGILRVLIFHNHQIKILPSNRTKNTNTAINTAV